jgi:hypothetical protein
MAPTRGSKPAPNLGRARPRMRDPDPEILHEGLNIACNVCGMLAVNAVHMPCCKEIICENCRLLFIHDLG